MYSLFSAEGSLVSVCMYICMLYVHVCMYVCVCVCVSVCVCSNIFSETIGPTEAGMYNDYTSRTPGYQ